MATQVAVVACQVYQQVLQGAHVEEEAPAQGIGAAETEVAEEKVVAAVEMEGQVAAVEVRGGVEVVVAGVEGQWGRLMA